MKYTEENMDEKPIFIIEEKPDNIHGQGESETPVITIESDEDVADEKVVPQQKQRKLLWVFSTAAITTLLFLAAAYCYWYYRHNIYTGISVSVKSEQNILKLQKPVPQEKPEVIMTTDSILGVPFNQYELRGLKAEISFQQPDTTDTEVYFYSRSADFTSYDPETNQIIGSLVQNGKEIQSEVCRLGYCAMANDNVVIGVARDEKVKDYCIEQGGSFFRQFILVSNGQLPLRFYLHGKVERRALARMGDTLYYIESLNKEGMTEFADALREYGFIDAIYITGGTDYSFYRDSEGKHHDIGDNTNKTEKHKGAGIVPWLVFKKR